MRTKKQKIVHSIVFVLIIVLLMGTVNYYVDSYAQIRVSYMDIARESYRGQCVTGLTESRYNERYLAIAMMETMEETPECIILGTSRSAVYGRDDFNADSFYNFSLSGGTLKDYYGIIGYLADREMLPDRVIIEVGGPLFNEADTDQRYTYLQGGIDYLKALMEGENIECEYPNVGRQYHKLLSIDYFKYNLQCLLEGERFEVQYTTEENNVVSTQLSDGSSMYTIEEENRSGEYGMTLARQDIANGNLYKIENYTAMSLDYTESFEALVAYLMSQGVNVEIFLPPYSEILYSHMEDNPQKYQGVFEQETYIMKMAEEKGMAVWGSYNPQNYNILPEDMLDAYHLKRKSAYKALVLHN